MRQLPARLFVVEDHAVMRCMICEAVERQPGLTVVGFARTAEDALTQLDSLPVDLVLVDVSLPHMSGLELVRRIRERSPKVSCLMVSGHTETSYAVQARQAGALGYVLKGRPSDLEEAIAACLDGGTYLSEPLRSKLEFDEQNDLTA